MSPAWLKLFPTTDKDSMMIHSTTQQEIRTYLEANLSSYLDLLRQMVAINSFTANPAGVNRLGELTAGAFAELGFTVETVQSVNPDYGRHVVLTRPGSSGRKLGLISHLDTVFPAEEEIRHNFVWRQEGQRIYGPGTVDIKGGTVVSFMVLEALRQFAPAVYEQMTWVLLLNASEEREAPDFGQLCLEQLGETALAALIFEGGRMVKNKFAIVAARKGMARYKAIVNGRAAHAGSNHPKGANAIVQLAEIIRQIAALTDYDHDLTFNVGTVSGGTVTNRVPHYAEAKIEMRAFETAVYEAGIANMLALDGQSTIRSVEGGYPCQVNVKLLSKVAPWAPNPATDRLLAVWQETAATLGMQAIREERGGLSDGNLIWQTIPTLDGLGPSGANAHCSEQTPDRSKEQEYVEANSLVPKALLNTAAILNLIEQKDISNDHF
jgi:glutamate carboxypeptidase